MKYWAYLRGEVPGCYTPAELVRLPDFAPSILVCPAEGENAEKNWGRASEIPEILQASTAPDAAQAAVQPASPAPVDVNAFIDATGSKLFHHVSRIVKELENRREEQELLRRLELEIMDLKARVEEADARVIERESQIQAGKARIADLEKTLEQEKERGKVLEISSAREGQQTASLRVELGKAKADHESLQKRVSDLQNDLAIRNRLVNKLSLELTEKELQLAKSLGIIRKLEEDLPQLGFPSAASKAHAKAAESPEKGKPSPAAAPGRPAKAQPTAPASSSDAPAQVPEENLAHKALVERLKKLVSRHTH